MAFSKLSSMTWREISPEQLCDLKNALVIDVRSPCEYLLESIPQAVNVPLLSDDERAQVGTVYKQEGEVPARRLALRIISPKIPQIVDAILALRTQGVSLVIHCWRGGLRSEAVVSFLTIVGIDCWRLTGGYKAWRRMVVHDLEGAGFEFDPVVLHGQTGVGKTEIARRLEAPVIERRPSGLDRTGVPNRGDAAGSPTRNGQSGNATPDRSAPSRNTDASSASPNRIQDGQVVRPDRKPRESEYRTVDRVPAPTRSLPESERSAPSRGGVDAPRSTPNREVNREADRPTRVETPRSYDPPARNESPKRYDPPPSRPVERPSSPPPSRDSAPSRSERAPERPSSPPPSRESSPPRESAPSKPAERAPERQSPPSREAPPSRPIKPNSQF